jgi:hypothetical protein
MPKKKHMFSPRALAVFMGIGPLIGAFGAGESFFDGLPFVLIPIYLVGSIVAVCAWMIYSAIFSVLHFALPIHSRAAVIVFGPSLLLWSALIGALCGLAVVSSYSCANSWLVYPRNCVADTLARFWGLSVLPGAVCGSLAARFINRRVEGRGHNNSLKSDAAKPRTLG